MLEGFLVEIPSTSTGRHCERSAAIQSIQGRTLPNLARFDLGINYPFARNLWHKLRANACYRFKSKLRIFTK